MYFKMVSYCDAWLQRFHFGYLATSEFFVQFFQLILLLAVTVDGYQGSYLPPQRLAPIQLQQGDATAATHQMQTNGLHRNNIRQDELFGIQIAGIKGVPVIEVSEDQRRELPTPTTLIESA